MFEPRLALASLSGESDAQWAIAASPWAGLAFLGGLALDDPTRDAARELVAERDRSEFLPADPFAFMDAQLGQLADLNIEPGFNVRAVERTALRRAASLCVAHDAVLEINAHCRQPEMTDRGAGQALLREPERLREQVEIVSSAGATVSVKVRAEVHGVALPALSESLAAAGADILHVDAMDSEPVIGEIADRVDAFLIANNGVRDRETARNYLQRGADAVSVARPSDDPRVLDRVLRGVQES
ncbi:MAG: tRNA-dihydrouridine synthase [Halobacteriota archaeon]